MRYPKDHKEKSRQRLITEAGKAFRKQGYGMIGVDGLAKSADLTSGAFYVHFASKKEAFLESLRIGLEELRSGIATFREAGKSGWLSKFAKFYLGEKRTCDLGEGCALPSLSSDVERAGDEARLVYETKLREIAHEMAEGLPGKERERMNEAWSDLALLLGGLTLARTVHDAKLSKEIAEAVLKKLDAKSS